MDECYAPARARVWTAPGQRSRVAHRLPTLSRLSPTASTGPTTIPSLSSKDKPDNSCALKPDRPICCQHSRLRCARQRIDWIGQPPSDRSAGVEESRHVPDIRRPAAKQLPSGNPNVPSPRTLRQRASGGEVLGDRRYSGHDHRPVPGSHPRRGGQLRLPAAMRRPALSTGPQRTIEAARAELPGRPGVGTSPAMG